MCRDRTICSSVFGASSFRPHIHHGSTVIVPVASPIPPPSPFSRPVLSDWQISGASGYWPAKEVMPPTLKSTFIRDL